jgi:hypothetical protein
MRQKSIQKMKAPSVKSLAGLAALLAASVNAQVQYTYATLDDPLAVGGTFAQGISGTNIVGYYVDSSDNAHGFLYNGSTWTILDDPLAGSSGGTFPAGISGANIVGYYEDSGRTPSSVHGFLFSGGAWITVDEPQPASGWQITYLTGVSGEQLVGTVVYGIGVIWSASAPKGSSGFVYIGGTFAELNDPSGSTSVQGISGTNIVGNYTDFSNSNHGFLYNGSTWATLDDPLAGPSGGTFPAGISGANIVGNYHDMNGNTHGFLAAPTPQLAITQSGNNLKISWPYPSLRWILRQNPDLTTTNWTPTSGISNDGTNSYCTITPSQGSLFFHLSQQ